MQLLQRRSVSVTATTSDPFDGIVRLVLDAGRFGFGLDQVDDLGAFPADEGNVAHPGREPQDQFVEEQDHRVVAKLLGVAADGVEAGVERNEALGGGPGLAGESAVMGPQERADQRWPEQLCAVALRICKAT